MCAILYFFLMVCNKPHANPTIIYENIKEIHILAVGGNLEFPILSHVLLRRDRAQFDAVLFSFTLSIEQLIESSVTLDVPIIVTSLV